MEVNNKLIDEIVSLSIKRSKFNYSTDDVKIINKTIKKLMIISSKLRSDNSETIECIISLLKNSNAFVRYQAAYILLPIETEQAKKVLTQISRLEGRDVAQLSFSAEMLLQEWEKGNIKF